MSTALKLGQEDHGRALTAEAFETAEFDSGHKYELIEGRLYVSPAPNYTHDFVHGWLFFLLKEYRNAHPEVINYVAGAPRVYLPEEPDETRPEPDLSAYAHLPLGIPPTEIRWRDHEPILAVEIVSPDDPEKDLVRNVRLYREVPSIREYWILDPRSGDGWHPSLLVYRRGKRGWQRPIRIPGGGTYSTPLLPGFTLVLEAHA
jgi:Uma2 family endonuclease